MDITYFGPSTDFIAQAFYDPIDDELDIGVHTNTPTLVQGTNPATGWEIIFTGVGLNAVTLAGTVTGLELRDDLGNTVVTFTNFAWPAASMVSALIEAVENDNPGPLNALLDLQEVNFDGSAAVDGVDLALDGLAGNLDIIGTPFDDTLEGGNGDDYIAGGGGRDRLIGNDGNDTLDASGGSTASQGFGDYVRPGLGSNTIIGHAGLYASGGGTTLSYANMGGVGTGLTITVGANGSGTAVASNTAVNDTFSHINYFEGSSGNDSVTGSNADHWEGFALLGGADTLNGRGGWDMLTYEYEIDYFGGAGSGITVNAAAGTVIDTQGNTDRFSNVEEIRGSNVADVMSAAGASSGMHFEGNGGNDLLTGSNHDDRLEGGNGNDTIASGQSDGNDVVVAGAGNDLVQLGGMVAGSDDFVTIGHWDLNAGISAVINGNTNTASINKGANGTTTITDIASGMLASGLGIWGTGFNDTFNITVVDGGWMQVNGGNGADSYIINASNGAIRLDFRDSNAASGIVINLGTGTVSNDGFGNVETISGTGSVWEVRGNHNGDRMTGSANGESFIGVGGNDTINGGGGFDRVRYDSGSDVTGLVVNLALGAAVGSANGVAFTQSLSNIEWVRGSNNADTINGSAGGDRLDGQDGVDRLNGAAGSDTLNGGLGNDRLDGGADGDILNGEDGNDLVLGGDGDDSMFGGAGRDRLVGGNGVDNMHGGSEQDTLLGGTGNDTMYGDDGDDVLRGNGDHDIEYGGAGNDIVIGGTGRDTLLGEADNDTLRGNGGFDTVDGGVGNDEVYGGSQADLVLGGAGNDSIFGGGGFDRLDGGIGDDEMTGNFNADRFLFVDGHGDDTITDFEATNNAERIDLSGVTAITDFADLSANHMSQVGANVLIDTGGGNSITLLGVNLADLDAIDFTF